MGHLRRLPHRFGRRFARGSGSNNQGSPIGGPSLGFDFISGTIKSTRGAAVTPTFTRASAKTTIDWEGRVQRCRTSEVSFDGMRRVSNLIGNSTDISSWPTGSGGTGVAPTVTGGFTAPDGTATAYRVQCNLGASFTASDISVISASLNESLVTGDTTLRSCWVKSNTGSNEKILFTQGGAGDAYLVTATTSWRRMAVFPDSNINTMALGLRGVGSCPVTCDVLVWHPQFERINNQTNQHPSEYVSTGSLSIPYQGANVDGVQYMRTLNANLSTATTTIPGEVTEKTGAQIPLDGVGWGWMNDPDATGTCFTTPDNTPLDLTTGVDLRFIGAAVDYTPAAANTLVSKQDGDRAYELILAAASGVLQLVFKDSGGTNRTLNSDAQPIAFIDQTMVGFRALLTFDADTTARVTYYYSLDYGTTWIQWGAQKTSASTGAIKQTVDTLIIGANGAARVNPFFGTIYRAQVLNISGTVVADFNPSDWTTGGSWTSSTTGEVWTIVGGAKVNKWPVYGITMDTQRTNLVVQSEDFSATWVPNGTPIRTGAAKRCGILKLDLLEDDDGAGAEGYFQTITYAGDGAKAVSCFFAQGTATTLLIEVVDTTAAATRLSASITWTNGLPSVSLAAGVALTGRLGNSCWEPVGNGVFRFFAVTSVVTAANVNSLRIFPAGSAANTGNHYVGGVQTEDSNASISTYIPTTTATQQRNGDLLTITGAQAGVNGANPIGIVSESLLSYVHGGAIQSIYGESTGGNNRLNGRHTNGAANMEIAYGTGAAVISLSPGAWVRNQVEKLAFSSDSTGGSLSRNGAAVVTNATASVYGAPPVTFYIGSLSTGGSASLLGGVRRIWFYYGMTTRLSDTQLQALSA